MSDEDNYRMQHRPSGPGGDTGGPLHDLTRTFPDDVYEHPHMYTSNPSRPLRQALRRAEGNPEADIPIYRALPHPHREINTGDWVALDPAYAQMHGAKHRMQIIKATVKAKHLWNEGNDLHEYGYHGPVIREAELHKSGGRSRPRDLDLYHRATPEAADQIYRERRMTSKENRQEAYFSTHRDGAAGSGYGESVVHVRVPEHLAELDDEFPDGEQHYRVKVNRLRPEHFVMDQIDKESSVQRVAGQYSDALDHRRELHADATERGHDMKWQRRQGLDRDDAVKPLNQFRGECQHCGAAAIVGSSWSTSDHPRRDARTMLCTGPGTKWQGDMERDLFHERARHVVNDYLRDIKDVHDRGWLRGQGIEASLHFAVLHGFAQRSDEDAQSFARRTASSGPKITVVAHVSGNSIDVMHCFAGETRYLTPEGPKSFAETVGTTQRVLTSSGGVHDGEWVEAPIRYYGDQQLWEVTLKRNKRTKVIRTTAGHRWLVGRPGAYRTVVTEDLRPEHRLAHLRPRKVHVQAHRDGIREGVMFGDGSIARRDYGAQTYGYITLWGDKAKDLGDYFEEICPSEPTKASRETGLTGLRFSSGMAGWTKDLPVISADPAVLRGWLMGYIATDGDVDQFGKVSLSSSVIEHLEYARTVALALGVGTYGIATQMRKGYGAEKSAIHSLAFATSDLDESWLLRQKHRDNFNKASRTNDRFGWTVVSVEQTDAVEAVYCAKVPGTESFALEDNVWTKNCPFCGSGALIARSDGTIEDNFCTAVFTVQVQPQFAAFPQTAEGSPYQWPGQPGPGQLAGGGSGAMGGFPGPVAGEEDDPEAEGGDGNPFADDADESGAGPDDGGDGPDDDGGKAQVGGKDAPPFGKKASFHTAAGHVLTEEDYLRHLALAHARNRGVVARAIRASQ